jgi:hypothetical protein
LPLPHAGNGNGTGMVIQRILCSQAFNFNASTDIITSPVDHLPLLQRPFMSTRFTGIANNKTAAVNNSLKSLYIRKQA